MSAINSVTMGLLFTSTAANVYVESALRLAPWASIQQTGVYG
jgi:hypothetical protein